MNNQTNLENPVEFSKTDDEIIRVKKIPQNPESYKETQFSTMGFDLDFNPETPWGEIRGEITHQYLKFVNLYLTQHATLLRRLLSIKNNLEQEIQALECNDLTKLIQITNIPVNELSANNIKEVEKFMNLQPLLRQSKNTLIHKKSNSINSQHHSDDEYSELDNLVKDELKFLIKKYGMKELTYAVDVITSSKLIRDNQDLE